MTHARDTVRSLMLGFSLVFMASTPVHADSSDPGYYLSLGAGVTADLGTDTFDILGIATGVDIDLEYGLNFAGAFGYMFGNGWRAEAEIAHTTSNVDAISTSFAGLELGETRATSLLLNGYYDFRQGKRLQPFVGAGIGVLKSKYRGTSLSIGGSSANIVDGDSSAAAQLILGLGYWVSDSVVLSAEYRYISTLDNGKYGLDNGNVVRERYDLHRLMVGMRYAF